MNKNGRDNQDQPTDKDLSGSPDEVVNDPNSSNMTDNPEEAADQVKPSGTDQLREDLEKQKDKYLRLAAEFDNYRKRTAKENLEIRMTASKDLMISLLEVLDDAERAEAQIRESKDHEQVLEGIMLIFNKLRKKLEQKGLKSIETIGTEFDVEKDEAVTEVPVSDEDQKGKVVAEIQRGYTLNDRIIRFAKVVVGR